MTVDIKFQLFDFPWVLQHVTDDVGLQTLAWTWQLQPMINNIQSFLKLIIIDIQLRCNLRH
jgi:hypothetical protein